MGRQARVAPAGMVYHVLNRANGRRQLFYRDEDYRALLRVLVEALRREPLELFAFCIMPNHWHLVLRPTRAGQLSRFMRWLAQTHVQRWRHAKHKVGEGSLYQGRFKSFPCQEDRHFLLLCRYVERNARRAKLARRAVDWRWSSAALRAAGSDLSDALLVELRGLLSEWPVPRPADWERRLEEGLERRQGEAVRECIRRSRPLGDAAWTMRTAARLRLSHTLRRPGRPKKEPVADGRKGRT